MRSVEITDNTVVKRSAPDLMRIEVAKTRRGGEIGRATGLFRVPQVLDFDEAAGRATFERLGGLRMLRHVLVREAAPDVATRLGLALAAIHRGLVLPEDMKAPLPDEFALPGETEVFLHGDFTVDNLYVTQPGEPLVVLDWQMTAVHGGRATFGTRYFDVTWFINTLFDRPVHRYFGASLEAPWAAVFFKSYFGSAGAAVQEDLRSYMNRFFTVKTAQRRREIPWHRRLLMAPANRRLWTFVRSFRL